MPADTPTDGRCNYEYTPGDGYSHDTGYCEGHPMDNGCCYHHGGQRENGGAPEGNGNAVRHEMFAERNAYYQRRSEAGQALIDAIYEDYREEFIAQNGREPLAGEDVKLSGIAVGIHKTEIRADDWPEARPKGLDTGHELVDRSEKKSPQGDTYYEYKPSAVLRGQKQVSSEIRMWLKELNLMPSDDDDGTTVNVNVHEELLSGLKAAHQD